MVIGDPQVTIGFNIISILFYDILCVFMVINDLDDLGVAPC